MGRDSQLCAREPNLLAVSIEPPSKALHGPSTRDHGLGTALGELLGPVNRSCRGRRVELEWQHSTTTALGTLFNRHLPSGKHHEVRLKHPRFLRTQPELNDEIENAGE